VLSDAKRVRASAPLERGLALFHEGGAAFDVVLAGEALLDDAFA
jgi:hypothetical protein